MTLYIVVVAPKVLHRTGTTVLRAPLAAGQDQSVPNAAEIEAQAAAVLPDNSSRTCTDVDGSMPSKVDVRTRMYVAH